MEQQTKQKPVHCSEALALTDNAMSVYSGELSREVLVAQCRRLKQAFPRLERGFFTLLVERLTANKFSNARLQDAINHVIDTCAYPQPLVASVISFDKQVKLYTYEQMLQMVSVNRNAFDSYYAVDSGSSTPMWAHRNDVVRYRLHLWKA